MIGLTEIREERECHEQRPNFVKPNEVELLACTHLPCTECLKVIAQKIDKVYFAEYLDNYDSDATIELAMNSALN